MADPLFDGRLFRILTVVDCHTREALAIALRASFRAYRVVELLDALVKQRGRPKSLRVDNGPGFAGRLLDRWACLNRVGIDFSRSGKPTDNAHIEAFNARLRAECLNACWFPSMADARHRIEQWRIEYNQRRSLSALGGLTPRAYAEEANQARNVVWAPDQRPGQDHEFQASQTARITSMGEGHQIDRHRPSLSTAANLAPPLLVR